MTHADMPDSTGRFRGSARTRGVRSRLLALPIVVLAMALPCTAAARADSTLRMSAAAERGDYVPGTLEIDGQSRRYLLRSPAGAAAPTAIVVLLHGGGGSAERLTGLAGNAAPYRAWDAIADRERLLLVVPQALDGDRGRKTPAWNDCRNEAGDGQTADDAAFLAALVGRLRLAHRVRGARTYAVGTSNGGMMALRLAVEQPGRFTAVAAIAAAMPANSECRAPTRSVPVLMLHGTEDRFVPWDGGSIAAQFGGRGEALSVADSIAIWNRLAGGSATPAVAALPDRDPDDGTRVRQEVFAMRGTRPQLMLIRVEGGGHTEPSPARRYGALVTRLLGRQSADIESADVVWEFFAAQTPRP